MQPYNEDEPPPAHVFDLETDVAKDSEHMSNMVVEPTIFSIPTFSNLLHCTATN